MATSLIPKGAKLLKRLAERIKEAKTPKGKKLAQEKYDLKRGEMLARKAYDDEVSRAPDPRTRSNRKMGGKITKRPMGGKVYKVDNSGQDLVQKMYGGKIKK